jgi:nitroreductase
VILDLIKERFSVRSFSPKVPADDKINRILEAGRLAPSWVNVQPWHFVVIKDQNTRELLSKLAKGQPHVLQAPVVIACLGDLSSWEVENYSNIVKSRGLPPERAEALIAGNPKLKSQEAVTCRTIEELTYAISYMTLAVHDEGLGCCVIGAIGNELTGVLPDVYAEVRKKLNIPENFIIITLLAIGYPSDDIQKTPKARKSFEEVVSFEKFGQKTF